MGAFVREHEKYLYYVHNVNDLDKVISRISWDLYDYMWVVLDYNKFDISYDIKEYDLDGNKFPAIYVIEIDLKEYGEAEETIKMPLLTQNKILIKGNVGKYIGYNITYEVNRDIDNTILLDEDIDKILNYLEVLIATSKEVEVYTIEDKFYHMYERCYNG